ncbi:hypothetical protein [Jeotgalicoccus sp. FSL K6-3177]|uniref:hypothetical protein n=1 Tax=Jeotgalicoccus sp. FSL K6-3177 TaxID=2921494 RepID=UPI0030FDD1D6
MANKLEQLLTEKQMKRLIENGIKKATVYHRIMYSKWDIDKAICTPTDERFTRKRGRRIIHGNRLTDEQVEIAKDKGISTTTLTYRLKTGMSVEEAITKKVGRKNKGAKRPGKLTDKERVAIFAEPVKKPVKYVKAKPAEWKPDPYTFDLYYHMFRKWS